MLSAALGVLNIQKTRGLRTQVTQTEVARNVAEQLLITRETDLKGREAAVAPASAKFGETRTKVESTEAELIKAQKGKKDLQAKLRENETEIAQLLKRIEQAEGKSAVSVNPSTASRADLQAQLEDAKKQLDAAEGEKLCSLTRSGPPKSDQPNWRQKRKGGSRLEEILEFAARCWQSTNPTILSS